MLLYILCVILTSIAMERFVEAIGKGTIFAALRAFVFNKANPELAPPQVLYNAKLRIIRLVILILRLVKKTIRFVIGERIIKLFWTFFHNILSCAFCLSGQISIVFALFLPGDLFGRTVFENWLLKAGLLWGCSNYIHTVFEVYRRGRVITHDYKITLETPELSGLINSSEPIVDVTPPFTFGD